MIRLVLLFLVASVAALPMVADDRPTQLHLAGDSTMASYAAPSPIWGWGMALGRYFVEPSMVKNHAVSGRSTKSFIARGNWEKLLAALEPGDFAIIQFGHNDEKVERPETGTDVATEFPDNLRRMVRDVRAKQATPWLATPVARRKFDASGRLVPTHGAYPDAVRAVAAELEVPLLDLERATSDWLQREGVEASKTFFVGVTPGAHPEGTPFDNTHFLESGAQRVAELAVGEIRARKLPLADWLR